jgi:hypothetical protein
MRALLLKDFLTTQIRRSHVYFNRQSFFPDYEGRFGKPNETQVLGLDFLLSQIESDERVTMIREAAYMLATVKGRPASSNP